LHAERISPIRVADPCGVIDHYDRHFDLKSSEAEKGQLVEYLKSL
jgi:hypothetical protein